MFIWEVRIRVVCLSVQDRIIIQMKMWLFHGIPLQTLPHMALHYAITQKAERI